VVFSSLIFLFAFLPIVLAGNFLLPFRFRNYFLLAASWIFFAWGGVSYSLLMIGSLTINYFIGLEIGKDAGSHRSKIFLTTGVSINLLLLAVFKYTAFLLHNLNDLLSLGGVTGMRIPEILLPLGISFYTFHAISYLVDVYHKKAEAQKKYFDLALYISFFPQLIAGPIIRYHDIAKQLTLRKNNSSNFARGIERFTIGLAKKVIIANTFSVLADHVFLTFDSYTPTIVTWAGIVAYSIQIYFDFSGYSDMAIGLGRMFGFHFKENFNHPYIAQSIRDFWTRWHISLSSWLRDYLYYPLGGSRNGKFNTYRNLIIVFFLTGLWHGASWTFVIWGLFHGTFLIIERLGFSNLLLKMPRFFRHFYTILVFTIARVFFRASDLTQAIQYLRRMFSFSPSHDGVLEDYAKYLNNYYYILFVLAILFSMPTHKYLKNLSYKIYRSLPDNIARLTNSLTTMSVIGLVLITFGIVTTLLSANSYNPFIYFRF
jgi:alginate O-acetyltransferase complex protein AlgI